jgi:hypothetical protein
MMPTNYSVYQPISGDWRHAGRQLRPQVTRSRLRWRDKETAEAVSLSVRTFEGHICRASCKVDVASRSEPVR